MTNPRESEVWGKKPEVSDRTLNERKYCKLCDYYYSEMYTCPICYGDDRAVERIVKLLETDLLRFMHWTGDGSYASGIDLTGFIALVKGESDDEATL